MAYKHILIAVDLSPESKVLVDKAVSMARPYNAKVSLIHVDVNYSDLYTGLIDVNLGPLRKGGAEAMRWAVKKIQEVTDLPLSLDTTSEFLKQGSYGVRWKAWAFIQNFDDDVRVLPEGANQHS